MWKNSPATTCHCLQVNRERLFAFECCWQLTLSASRRSFATGDVFKIGGCHIITSLEDDNYCGWLRNPAPVHRWLIPLFIGFQPSFWWCRISSTYWKKCHKCFDLRFSVDPQNLEQQLIPFGSQRWEIPQLNGGFNEEIHLKFEVLMGTKTSINGVLMGKSSN